MRFTPADNAPQLLRAYYVYDVAFSLLFLCLSSIWLQRRIGRCSHRSLDVAGSSLIASVIAAFILQILITVLVVLGYLEPGRTYLREFHEHEQVTPIRALTVTFGSMYAAAGIAYVPTILVAALCLAVRKRAVQKHRHTT